MESPKRLDTLHSKILYGTRRALVFVLFLVIAMAQVVAILPDKTQRHALPMSSFGLRVLLLPASAFNFISKSRLFASLLGLWNICETCKLFNCSTSQMTLHNCTICWFLYVFRQGGAMDREQSNCICSKSIAGFSFQVKHPSKTSFFWPLFCSTSDNG